MHSARLVSRLNGRLAYVIVAEAWLVYVFLTIFAPAANTFDLNWLQRLLVSLSVAIPVLFIWLIGAYGAVRFKAYTYMIRGSQDGLALSRITDGLLVLVANYVLSAIVNVLQRYAVGTPLLEPLVFLHNHLPVLLYIIALSLIYNGSSKLIRLAGKPVSARHMLTVLIPFTVVSALFSVFYFTNLTHTVTNGVPNFIIPGKGPFFTIAIPSLVVWLLGSLSMLNIVNYIINVKGAIYKVALKRLATGIMMVVSFTVLVQLLTVTARAWTGLGLGLLLAIVYLVLLAYSAGFVLIAIGARRLTKIEAAV